MYAAFERSLFNFISRELFEHAFRWSLCASAFASVNLKAVDHCNLRTKPDSISQAQALFFCTKHLVLNPTATLLSTAVNWESSNLESSAQQRIEEAFENISCALKLLDQKGSKLGRDFSNSEEILKAARLLISGLTGSKKNSFSKALISASAAFARWAHRLGHPDAEQFLREISARSVDATYFLARILQKTSSSDVRQIEDMYKKVEKSDCVSAIKAKAKQRLLMIKWPKPVAARRIYVWFFNKHRQRSAQSRTKSLRDFNALLCEAELKFPYSFCEQICAAGSQMFLN